MYSNHYNLASHADVLKGCQVAVSGLTQHVFELRVVFESPERAADFERDFLA